MDFVIADKAQTGAIYFMASEEDLRIVSAGHGPASASMPAKCLSTGRYMSRTPIRAPWVLCRASSAATSVASISCHSNARFADHFSARSARTPRKPWLLKSGYFADITIFDPATIIDHATSRSPTSSPRASNFTIVNGQVECTTGN